MENYVEMRSKNRICSALALTGVS